MVNRSASPFRSSMTCRRHPDLRATGKKPPAKTPPQKKTTYPSLFGIDESLRQADALIDTACNELNEFGPRASTLKELARFLVERKK